ncbi:hypothetical protein Csa_011671 [Cucumis sativus]|uniref:Uncharacterized protein n=1 Tax=Cucumis sativus TaxID=3659 RepID=A0A0A0LB21_CUCSA|nr:hypothetical protein Csa_011671 [Cucumis sativus]
MEVVNLVENNEMKEEIVQLLIENNVLAVEKKAESEAELWKGTSPNGSSPNPTVSFGQGKNVRSEITPKVLVDEFCRLPVISLIGAPG